MATKFDKYIGSRVRKARKEKRIPQAAVAAQLGVSFQQIQHYENGKHRISASSLYMIAQFLQRPIMWFFGGDECQNVFYDFEYNDELFDLDYKTSQEVEAFAQGWWGQRHEGLPMRNGERSEDWGYVVRGFLDDEGDLVEVSRDRITLYYQHYHGDFKEHNTLYVGGSL